MQSSRDRVAKVIVRMCYSTAVNVKIPSKDERKLYIVENHPFDIYFPFCNQCTCVCVGGGEGYVSVILVFK